MAMGYFDAQATKIYQSMHALAVDNQRQRDAFLLAQTALKPLIDSKQITADRLQEGNIRAFFKLTASTRTISFKLNGSDGNSVVSELEKLILSNRVVLAFAASVGICQVPIVSTIPQFANAVFTNDPTNAIFSAAEITALKGVFNSFIRFKTNGTDRSQTLAAQRFLVKSADASDTAMKHITLQGLYTMVGGQENELQITIPPTGDITQIGGKADGSTVNYAFVDFMVIDILAPDAVKDKLLSVLS